MWGEGRSDDEIELIKKQGLKDTTMWFDVYGNTENILIQLKN